MITRRRVLQGFAVGGAAVFTGAVPEIKAQLGPATRRRREINGLALNDPIVQTLRDGVRLLKARGPGQGPTWTQMSAIHGTASGFNKCPHGNWYFLPWHRAYLLMYERMIRSATGNNSFAMPYWDWAAHRDVPQAFSEADHNGQPNPLYVAARNNNWSVTDSIAGPNVMSSIYGQTNFELFGSSRAPGQNNTNQSWIRVRGTQGTLEANPHNNIHINLGGFMPDGNSPMDPIFLMHHGNIDRIWWSWNCRGGINSSDPLWRNMPFTDNYYNPDGSWRTWQPSQLLNISTLGYSYGLCLRPLPQWRIRTLANARLAQIFRAGTAGRANAAGALRLEVRRQLRGPALEAVGAAPPRSLRSTFLNLAPARQQAMPQPRAAQSTSQVVALIHDLTPPSDQVEVLVFAGTGSLPPTDDPRDRSFVTSIGFFGAHAHAGHGVSASVDLTEHLRALGGDSDQVVVRLVPRASGRRDGAVQETVARAQVEVVFV